MSQPARIHPIAEEPKQASTTPYQDRYIEYNRRKQEIYNEVCLSGGGEEEFFRRIKELLQELHI